MNDFLQSLRNGQAEKPRSPKTRKNYDNSYQYTSAPRFHSYSGYANTRNQQMKRPAPAQQQPGNQMPSDDLSTSAILAEAIENLNTHIEALTKNQDYLISVQEKTADMLERQAIAIERIVEHLNLGPAAEAMPKKAFQHHYISSRKTDVEEDRVPDAPTGRVKKTKTVIRKRKRIAVKQPVESPVTDTRLLGREEVMEIINSMRADGATYDEVASHLIALGQPTFSGRGEWHAQTIHRLCNRK